jgi:hypothetical protein
MPLHRADNLTAICEPTLKVMWEPRRATGLHGLLTGIALPFACFNKSQLFHCK